MSTTYMVKSSLVFLACHINVVLMTILFLFNVSKSTKQHYVLNVFQLVVYILGLIFNIYVVLYASRKWELVMKYFENSTNYMLMLQHEIRVNLLNSIKDAVQQISTLVCSILEDCSHLDSGDSAFSPKPVKEAKQIETKKEEPVARMQSRPIISEEPVITSYSKQIYTDDILSKILTASEERTPELKVMYNLRNLNRPKSDPIKKTAKIEVIKTQSPELLKNKIFKSRMYLACDSPVSRKDK